MHFHREVPLSEVINLPSENCSTLEGKNMLPFFPLREDFHREVLLSEVINLPSENCATLKEKNMLPFFFL